MFQILLEIVLKRLKCFEDNKFQIILNQIFINHLSFKNLFYKLLFIGKLVCIYRKTRIRIKLTFFNIKIEKESFLMPSYRIISFFP